MDVSQILPNLFVGSFPNSSEDIDRLKQEFGVTAVLSVQTDDDMAYWGVDWPRLKTGYDERRITVQRIPVPDFPEDLRRNVSQCVAALDDFLRQGHTVYVHCNLGANRSPSIAIAYLHWIQGWNLETAITHLKKCRWCNPYVEAIRQAERSSTP